MTKFIEPSIGMYIFSFILGILIGILAHSMWVNPDEIEDGPGYVNYKGDDTVYVNYAPFGIGGCGDIDKK